jgi:hypothetical protein
MKNYAAFFLDHFQQHALVIQGAELLVHFQYQWSSVPC